MHSTVQAEQITPRFNIRDLGLGALAGVIGGVAMGIVGMLVAVWYGYSIWKPLAEIAGVFRPELATATLLTFETVLIGIFAHFAIAAGLGILFVLIYRGLLDMPSSMMVFPAAYGIIFGLLVWFVSSQIIGSVDISGRSYVPTFIIQHLVFGGVLGLTYGLMRPARAYLPRY